MLDTARVLLSRGTLVMFITTVLNLPYMAAFPGPQPPRQLLFNVSPRGGNRKGPAGGV
jgi:hypothetical protein